MTNLEYITKMTAGLGILDGDIELILAKGALNGADIADMRACDTAIFNNQSIIYKAVVESAKEGGYSVERSKDAISRFLSELARENGLETVTRRTAKAFINSSPPRLATGW
jgi:hypothetical protein